MPNIRHTTRRKLIFALWLVKPTKKAEQYTFNELINNFDL